MAIFNNTEVAASESSLGQLNFEKDTTAEILDNFLVVLSRILKADTIDAAVKFGPLNVAGHPLIAPYSTTT